MRIFEKFIFILLVLLIVSTVCYSAEKVYTWKMASIYNDPATQTEGNANGEAQQLFVDLVKEKTNGQVIIKPFYGSVLGGNIELFEQLKRGQLEVYYGQPMSSIDPRFGAWNIPYLFKDYEEAKKIVGDINGDFFKLSQKWIKDNHGELLAIGGGIIRGLANCKHIVKGISDLKGLKLRTYQDPIVSIFWSKIVITQPLTYAEMYSALQTKTVDAVDGPISMFLGSIGELVRFYTDIDWQWTTSSNLVVNEKVWKELPENLQKSVQEAAIEAMKFQGETQTKYVNKAFATLEKERGYVITKLNTEEKQEWINYARTLDEEIKNVIGIDTFDDIMNAVKSGREKISSN